MPTNIIIVSSLKPVDDARGFEKLALSLKDAGKYNVHLAGPPPSGSRDLSDFVLHIMPRKSYNIAKRLLSAWRLWPVLIKVKPKLIIATSHDLLVVITLYKIIFGARLVYDIQENYYRNLVYQKNYSFLVRWSAAVFIRLKEFLTSPLITYFLLAESSYRQELSFIGNRHTILENKAVRAFMPVKVTNNSANLELLLTGTISPDYGALDALKWFKAVRTSIPGAILKVSGHCTQRSTRKLLEDESRNDENVILELSEEPVAHQDVLTNIASCDFLLLPYPQNRSTENCIPAKLYESIAIKTPILISPNPLWHRLITEAQGGLSVDFTDPQQSAEDIKKLGLAKFYTSNVAADVFWDSEAQTLRNIISSIL